MWRKLIVNELREQWTAWKCAWIGQVVADLRSAALAVKPDTEVFLNGFGLGRGDFGNAVEEVLGQRFAELDASIDYYELMFYFQILKRDPLTWIPQRIAEAKLQTRRSVLACLQGGAEYLEPMYRNGGRKREITEANWEDALRGVARSSADGLMVYSWRDLLADEAAGVVAADIGPC